MPEPTLPAEEDIAKLPRWARVAFAARCARRALPSFKEHWPDAPQTVIDDVIRALETAEAYATNGMLLESTDEAWTASMAAASSCRSCRSCRPLRSLARVLRRRSCGQQCCFDGRNRVIGRAEFSSSA